MKAMLGALKTLAQGFMFGLGLCMAALVAFYVSQNPHFSAASNNFVPGSEVPTQTFQAVKGLEFKNVEEIKQDGKNYFTGIVRNNKTAAVSGVNIEVNLFNKGKFVDQYSSYVAGSLATNEERYFKVSCGCKDSMPATHDTYKIAAVSGY